MNPPNQPKPMWTPPCYFDAFMESTKEEVACAVFGRMVSRAICGRDCSYYKPLPGNA